MNRDRGIGWFNRGDYHCCRRSRVVSNHRHCVLPGIMIVRLDRFFKLVLNYNRECVLQSQTIIKTTKLYAVWSRKVTTKIVRRVLFPSACAGRRLNVIETKKGEDAGEETAAQAADNLEVAVETTGEAEEDMSAETEIEVSVVSEEDLEASRGSSSSPHHSEMLLQDKQRLGCNIPSHPFSFDVGKAALRPACNAHYTSFSISSILGRSESPTANATAAVSIVRSSSDAERGSPPAATTSQKLVTSCESSPTERILSPTSLILTGGSSARSIVSQSTPETRNSNPTIGLSWSSGATTSPPSFTASGDHANPLMGHQASANLAMLSR
ncbi:hypothetical protein KQX54_010207 [Cotesia glomerata]|uniref:Uncharacterized protein n=1 Tax=Cotesia glomerata TaxID=32391 RepID=A0AAV7ISV9_COTGL|nr:hypothetical protein KQX54_010207 [Cotesia glomerata]